MLERLRQARLIWPTVSAVAGLAVLVGLGSWQLQRKQWKEGLQAKITERAHSGPSPLARAAELVRGGGDAEYLHVVAKGTFQHDKERYLYAPGPSGQGWHVYTPLEVAPRSIVWVNRGFVSEESRFPWQRSEGQVTGEVEVRGLVRLPLRPSKFTPDNDVVRNIWYWPDVAAMTASAFKGTPVDLLPLVVDADASPAPPGGLPRGGVTNLRLPNRHLEYALTWFGIAATLIGVYFAFAAGRLRAARPPE